MAVEDCLLAAIALLYDAAMDQTLWPAALQSLADLTGSQAATLWVLDGSEQPSLPAFLYINFDAAFIRAYLDHMTPMDPTVQYLLAHPQQPIVHDGLYLTERDIDQHPYYAWHTRHSDARYRLLAQIQPVPDTQAGIALHRTRAAGRYQAPDVELLQRLYRHVQHALAVGIRLGTLDDRHQSAMDLLDRNPVAVLFLDRRQRLVHANHSAETIANQCDGIQLAANGLRLSRDHDNRQLARLIGNALATTSTDASPGGAMSVSRPSGKRAYVLRVTPVSERSGPLSFSAPAVCVLVTDPDQETILPEQTLQSAFGLTAAESRLACRLAAGDDLESAAVKLSITYGSARARLAEIFQKTQTHRQGELIRLLLTTLALI